MDMTIIKPLLVADMKQRMLNAIDSELAPVDDMIEQIGRCTTMSSINQLLCSYHYLFTNHPKIGNVVSVDGTQEYVIRLLTERIETDADIIYDALKYG